MLYKGLIQIDDELRISWDILLHPDMDAINRRNKILKNTPDLIIHDDGSMSAEIDNLELQIRRKKCSTDISVE